MKLIPANEVPKRKHPYHSLQKLIKDFCNDDNKIVKVEFDNRDYKNIQSAYVSLYKAARHSKRPVKVCMRGDEIYLTKV